MRLLANLLGQQPQDDWLRLEESATEVHVSAAVLEALAMSHGDLAQLLRAALKASHAGDNTYVWTRDVYDDAVVYELSYRDEATPTALYQRSYTVADGAVTFGDPIQVVAVTQYMPVAQAAITVPAVQVTQVSQPAEESDADLITGNLVPLVEKAVAEDGTALIKIIQAGQGSSGYYPADVLKRDGPKAFHAGLHLYLDHPSSTEDRDRPERSVKDLAGSLTGAAEWKEDGTAGPGLYAPVKFIDSVAPHINAIAAISGMSIRAFGKSGKREIEGKKVSTVESIDSALSVDVVTRPGAGGKVVELLEAARAGRPLCPDHPKEGDRMTIQEQLDAATQELDETKGKLGEAQQRIDQQDRDLARLREQNILREANLVIAETLADLELHQLTRDRLTKQLIASPPVKDGDLDTELFKARVTEAARAEQNYLVLSGGGGGGVRGMGGTDPGVPSVEESGKRISEAIAAI